MSAEHDHSPPNIVVRDLDWTRLIASAERQGIPVSRLDEHGRIHIIRTTQQLREEWE